MRCRTAGELSWRHAGGCAHLPTKNHRPAFGAAVLSRRTRPKPSFGDEVMVSSYGVLFPGLAVEAALVQLSHAHMHAPAHRVLLTKTSVPGKSRGASKPAAGAASWRSPSASSEMPLSFAVSGVADSCRMTRSFQLNALDGIPGAVVAYTSV